MASVDGDMELFREIVQLFLRESPETMAKIHGAIREENAMELDRAAHTLKGSAGNFGARPVFETALKLEMMGKSGDLAGGIETYSVLSLEMDRLKLALEEFAGAGQ